MFDPRVVFGWIRQTGYALRPGETGNPAIRPFVVGERVAPQSQPGRLGIVVATLWHDHPSPRDANDLGNWRVRVCYSANPHCKHDLFDPPGPRQWDHAWIDAKHLIYKDGGLDPD